MISAATIDKVNDLLIYDVVSKYIDLKKSGANYSAKSPFSNEKTASFYVVPKKNIYKCFSSGHGGGPIDFVMQHQKLTYPQAIEEMCNKFNIRIEYEANGQPKEYYDELESLYKLNRATARLYTDNLLEVDGNHPAFVELISKRRFSPDTIAQWNIGLSPGVVGDKYTPEKWNALSQEIIKVGLYKQGIDLGLIKTKGTVTYDAFRNRIMYPIIDHRGRYAGFGGRALKADEFNAKYLNSPESKIFNKSKILFGLYFAAQSIRERGYANLMEGYTDVISFHQAKEINSVGTCGTALTEDQVKLLKGYTNRVVLFYDPDEAGQRAAAKSIDMLMKEGFQSSVVPMPSIIELKRGQATAADPNPQPFREVVFIRQQRKDSIIIKHDGEEIEIARDNITEIVKVDPDELVRFF